MLPPVCEASPKRSYRSSSSSPYPRIAPRLPPRALSPVSDSSSGRLSPLSVFTSSTFSSRRSSIDTNIDTPSAVLPRPKRCSHCSATSTPLWRRNPATREPLCNACGLYLQQRHTLRPLALIEFDAQSPPFPSSPEFDDADPDAPECSHCHTRHTSVWRRHKTTGAKLCNACGVYARLRGKDRPLTLKRERIRPRGRHPK
ncbi:hypothetical protein C8R45DRAFT_834485 [Mycena sanguinolenta]|nr:hypothetical protein C8R45DRAFT_834485 [Mycena sanguinolenta]